mgnify:CR=1 FL=1
MSRAPPVLVMLPVVAVAASSWRMKSACAMGGGWHSTRSPGLASVPPGPIAAIDAPDHAHPSIAEIDRIVDEALKLVPALEAARNGDVTFVPERYTGVYTNWMENIHDWCISRQIWWGHRIPVYYCKQCYQTIWCPEGT